MLVGLTAQSLTVGTGPALIAFGLAAATFVGLLAAMSLTVSRATAESLKPIRMSGPAVRTFGGMVLIIVGLWFIILSLLPGPVIGS